MHLLFSKIRSNGTTLKLRREIKTDIDYKNNLYFLKYDPLNISINSSNGKNLINNFLENFINLWKNRNNIEQPLRDHLKEIVV
jgi:hypothetical protein